MRSRTIARVAATWMAEGNTSLDDCEALTWSLGCTGVPVASVARVAMTSLVFMLLDVPEPVWKTSMGKWSSHVPDATSPAASVIARATSPGRTPRSALTRAAAPLMAASAAMSSRSMGVPEIGKFSTARWVWARHLAQAGTRTSPMESRSMRWSCSVATLAPVWCRWDRCCTRDPRSTPSAPLLAGSERDPGGGRRRPYGPPDVPSPEEGPVSHPRSVEHTSEFHSRQYL